VAVVQQDSDASDVQMFDVRTLDRAGIGLMSVNQAMGRSVLALSASRAMQFDRVT
jgi:hypothetical protein